MFKQKLLDYSLKLLKRRPYSKSEIQRKLTQYLYKIRAASQGRIMEEIIALLEEKNLINDLDLAKWFVYQREEFRPRSKRAIFYELNQKGIAREIIEKALLDYSEEEAIKKIVNKKGKMERKKLVSYLLSQGFPYELINSVL